MKDGKYGVDYGKKLHCKVTVDTDIRDGESKEQALRRLQQTLKKANVDGVHVWSIFQSDVRVQDWERLSW